VTNHSESRTNPLVSVVIPMYNASTSIGACLASVKSQDYRPLEVIIVDDGSVDDSSEIVEQFISKDAPNVSFQLIRQSNGGVSVARNKGLQAATGDFIAFIDSDDEWKPGKLTRQIALLLPDRGVGLVACNPIRHHINRFLWKSFKDINLITPRDLAFKNYFQPSTVVVRNEVARIAGRFDPNQRYAEEGIYFMRIAAKCKALLINENLIVYGRGKAGFGESGLSANIHAMERGELKNLHAAVKERLISKPVYLCAVIFSVVKYIVRMLRSVIKK
jgi:glycosyltransferase involved in cell wall biosynthesis